MRSQYLLKTNQQFLQQDLPIALKQDFEAICNTALTQDPYGCFGLPNHQLKGDLAHCRAIEIDYIEFMNPHRLSAFKSSVLLNTTLRIK